MKKSLKLAAAAAVFATPAFAANLENPLYTPKAGEVYSKTSAGIMYKIADATDAQIAKGHQYAEEFPIWRLQEDLGVGITDRLSVNGQFGYTSDPDIDRAGLHLGRLGLNYRIFDDARDFVWDIYADAHLGGVSKMTGEITNQGFKYDNYGTGQYGFYAGTRIGKTWGDLTGSLYAEVGHFFANDNSRVSIAGLTPAAGLLKNGLSDKVVADLKSYTDWNIGTKWAYEIDSRWTSTFAFAWKHHAAHSIAGVKGDFSGVDANALSTVKAGFAALENNFKGSLEDSFDEFPITVAVANQLNDALQVAVYGEYTFDTGGKGSQNSTDAKVELGVRLNAQF